MSPRIIFVLANDIERECAKSRPSKQRLREATGRADRLLRESDVRAAAVSVADSGPAPHPCPSGDFCALNSGAVHCFACRRNWPRDETWDMPFEQRPNLRAVGGQETT